MYCTYHKPINKKVITAEEAAKLEKKKKKEAV
jgi:hypothetical protein